MQNDNVPVVPYIAHESEMARMERTIRRLWIALILALAVAGCLRIGKGGRR